MKTLVCAAPGRFEYSDARKPVLQKGMALVRIKRIGICGTDLHAFEGRQPYFQYPRILGHELAGELAEGNDVPGFAAGEAVTFLPYFHCGRCIACRNGKPNCCTRMQVCGVHVDGGMAEYLSVPAASLVKSEGLGFDELASVEPLAIGAHGIRRAAVVPGEFVLVIGAGPIGLGTMEFARIAGGQVIALDLNEGRLQYCRQQLGIAHTLSAASEDVVRRLEEITSGDMPTVVIDATGSTAAINKAFSYMAHGGRFVLIGLQRDPISFSHPEFHKREGTLMSSRNATRQDFEQVINRIKSGSVQPTRYITHRAPFREVKEVFPRWLDPASGVIKAMVEMP
ncbi:MAG TPA: zinc-binding alcohol dehydrogenase family protein [Chitinophagaceae bacterium]|jgi:2-desacetyl-2-hydroxyethyl bacteriochlorophyllide A dehydrogenase|nr:zinc-binding alcohol dehydrogenase family protein [Chitinophagaceae bacterium]